MLQATTFQTQRTQPNLKSNEADGCDSWKVAAGILAVAFLALTVVAVMARQGLLPSCTFGGQGGATVVAVASGVLTILALSLASCRPAHGHNKSPKQSREGSSLHHGHNRKDSNTNDTESKDGGNIGATVAAAALPDTQQPLTVLGTLTENNGQRRAWAPPHGDAAGNNAAGDGVRNGPGNAHLQRQGRLQPSDTRQQSMASNAGNAEDGLADFLSAGSAGNASTLPTGSTQSSARGLGQSMGPNAGIDLRTQAWLRKDAAFGI